MKPNATREVIPTENNVVKLDVVRKPARLTYPPPNEPRKARFKIVEYTNPRSGTTSWRVTGMKPNGERVRDNYSDPRRAEAERLKLEADHLACPVGVQLLQPTHLSLEQVKIAESAFAQIDKPEDLLAAVHHWKRSGKVGAALESCRLDEAIKSFGEWLDSPECDLALESKKNYKTRLSIFGFSMANVMVEDIGLDDVKTYLTKRSTTVGKTCCKNDKRAVSRLLSYAVEKKWLTSNPCLGQRKRHGGKIADKKLPEILTLKQCKALLKAAEQFKDGVLAPYTALCLLAGVRPNSEAKRLTWNEINLEDGELTIQPWQSKTGQTRTFKIGVALDRWLRKYKGKAIYPSCFLKGFRQVKKMAGITKWVVDVMRHTSHSHYFRKCGSFGLTAEFHGNSESTVRKHYMNRVTEEEAKRFYALRPAKKAK